MTTSLLNSFYEAGNAIGVGAAWVMVILFAIIWIWVMFKYLDTSDLN